MTGDELRGAISELVRSVRPADARETADQADILDWIASGEQLFRTVAPGIPPKHLVVYFVPVDTAGRLVLLGDHVKSGLWLPPGGHVEDGEDPRRSVEREALEELGIDAAFHDRLGAGKPFFLTVTPTLGEPSHTDVSLWFALACPRSATLRPDPREFRSIRWFAADDQAPWPGDRFDPEMGRFIRKLTAAVSRPSS